MASSLDVFDEKNYKCLVCDEILKNPKLLPCLHRFCNDCLTSLLESEQGTFECPECMEKYESSSIRENGLKNDLYTANAVECIHIRNSLRDGTPKECFDCCNETKMFAYCFKCKDYLCDKCYKQHAYSKILKEHRKHTVTMTEFDSNQMSLGKCFSLKETPKCHIHTQTESQVCCITCENQPICEACTYGEHMGHNLREVSTWANSESLSLSMELERLEEHMKKFDVVRESVKDVKQKVVSKFNEAKNEAQSKHESKISGVKEKIKRVREEDHLSTSKVERLKETYFEHLEREKEREIQKVKQRYSNLVEKKKNEYDRVQRQYEERLTRIHQALKVQDEVFQMFLDKLEKKQSEIFEDIQKTEKRCDSRENVAKNAMSTAFLVTSTKNDWLVAQYIPTVCNAIQHFLNLKEIEFPNLDNIPDVSEKVPSFEIFKKDLVFFESTSDIQVIQSNLWDIDCITSTKSGSIVISGRTSRNDLRLSDTFVSVINIEGDTLRKDKMKTTSKTSEASPYPNSRYCTMLSEFRVATVAKPNEIGIYDVRNGSYIREYIGKAVHNALGKDESTSGCDEETELQGLYISQRRGAWDPFKHYDSSRKKEFKGQKSYLTCVAADLETVRIFVGYANKGVYVFDDQLKYLHPFKLPDKVKSLQGMTFSNGNLIVCDKQGEKAYVIGVNESEGSVLLEIPTPDVESGDWIPQGSVCTDSKGNIYLIWSTVKDRIVVKYSADGGKLLKTRRVGTSAFCMSTIIREGTEKLLIVTAKKEDPSLSIYSLDHFDVKSTIKPLMEVITTECPELNFKANTSSKEASSASATTKTNDTTKDTCTAGKINMEVIQANNWVMDGITSTRDGSIVISGRTSSMVYSASDMFISVINTKGNTLRKNKMKSVGNLGRHSDFNYRYCTVVSEFKVATVAMSGEIGIYDVRDGSYMEKDISETIQSVVDKNELTGNNGELTFGSQTSPSFENISVRKPTRPFERMCMVEPKRPRDDLCCVTADSEHNRIFVGYKNKDVYVFDDQLNYKYPFHLPKALKSLQGMAAIRGTLIVSDRRGGKVSVVEINQCKGKKLLEILNPTLDSGDWIPQGSVCIDSKGFIYVMWLTIKDRMVIKYTADGREELAQMKVPMSAFCMTTLESNDTTYLLVGAQGSGVLQVFPKLCEPCEGSNAQP